MVIHELTRLAQLDAYMQQLPGNALILWDFNYVLFAPAAAFFRPLSWAVRKEALNRRIGPTADPEAFWQLYCRLSLAQELAPVEPETVSYVQQLLIVGQHRMVLLSYLPAGALGGLVERQRCDTLERAQLHFDERLFASPPSTKADILGPLISQKHPAHVLFVDDSPENVWDVGTLVAALGVPFTGIVYREQSMYGEPPISLSHAEIQLAHFDTYTIWLPDVQVKREHLCACDYCKFLE
jgi:hypothetical protein